MSRKKRLIARILFLIYLAIVAFLCFGKFSGSSPLPSRFAGIPMDKIIHFLMFFPFPILSFLSFDKYTESIGKTLLYVSLTLLAGALVACTTELVQSRLSYRSGDPMDFLADLLALFLGSVLIFILDIRKQK